MALEGGVQALHVCDKRLLHGGMAEDARWPTTAVRSRRHKNLQKPCRPVPPVLRLPDM